MEFFCEYPECFNVATEHDDEAGMIVCERHYYLDWEWNEPDYLQDDDDDYWNFQMEAAMYH